MHIWTVMTEWIHQLTPWVGVGLAALESLFPPITADCCGCGQCRGLRPCLRFSL